MNNIINKLLLLVKEQEQEQEPLSKVFSSYRDKNWGADLAECN